MGWVGLYVCMHEMGFGLYICMHACMRWDGLYVCMHACMHEMGWDGMGWVVCMHA